MGGCAVNRFLFLFLLAIEAECIQWSAKAPGTSQPGGRVDQEVLPGRRQECVILSIWCHVWNNAEILCFGDGWGGDAKKCV